MSTATERAARLRRLDMIESILKQYGFTELTDDQFLGVVAMMGGRADSATYEACVPQRLEARREEAMRDALSARQARFFNRTGGELPEQSRFITAATASYFPGEHVPPHLAAELHARAHSSYPRVRDDARRELAVLRTDDAIELRAQFHARFVAWLDPLVEEYESSDWAEYQRTMRARHYGYSYEPIMDEHERHLARRHHPRPWDPIDRSRREREEHSPQEMVGGASRDRHPEQGGSRRPKCRTQTAVETLEGLSPVTPPDPTPVPSSESSDVPRDVNDGSVPFETGWPQLQSCEGAGSGEAVRSWIQPLVAST